VPRGGWRGQGSKPKAERFARKVVQGPGCWEWRGWRNRKGYGTLITYWWDGDVRRRDNDLAHRLAYEYAFGPIPPGLFVCHRCDNPGCVRPDHLYAGTVIDNTRDREARGRRTHFRGEESGLSILTADEVRAMRVRRADGLTYREIGEEFGRKLSTVAAAITGQNWRHLV
jgi:hypothetical protein